jgi:hypothetical protein
LHEQVENLAFVVNRAPQPELPARNRHGHLVEMPPRRWPWTSTAKLSSEQRPEFQNPSPHRFVGDIQTAHRKQIFDVAIAERETEIEPNGVPDDSGRKLVAGKRLLCEPRRATVAVTEPRQQHRESRDKQTRQHQAQHPPHVRPAVCRYQIEP